MYTTDTGLLAVRQLNNGGVLYQHITISTVTIPDPLPLRHKSSRNTQFVRQTRKAKGWIEDLGGSADAIYIKQREFGLLFKSETNLSPEQIMKNRLEPVLKQLINHGVDLHFNPGKNSNYLITGIYYHPIRYSQVLDKNWRKKQQKKDVSCGLLRLYDVAPYRKQVKYSSTKLSVCPHGVHEGYYQYIYEQTLKMIIKERSRSRKRPDIGNIFSGNTRKLDSEKSIIGYHLDHLIDQPKRLAVIGEPQYISRCTHLFKDQITIKIGGIKPSHYKSLNDIDIGFDLLGMMQEVPSVYTPILGLMEAGYYIRQFAQTFRMFYDMMEESLSPEDRSDFTIERIVKMLKEVPLASFEIPIDQKTKIALLQFFLKFPYTSYLSDHGSVTDLPQHLYIPTSKKTITDDLILLNLYVHYLDLNGIEVDTIIVDSHDMQYQMSKDLISPNLPLVLSANLVHISTFPKRKHLDEFTKLVIYPTRQLVGYLEETDKVLKPQENRCYLITEHEYIYEITPDRLFYLESVAAKPLIEIEEEEFVELEEFDEIKPVDEDPQERAERLMRGKSQKKENNRQKSIPSSSYSENDVDDMIDSIEVEEEEVDPEEIVEKQDKLIVTKNENVVVATSEEEEEKKVEKTSGGTSSFMNFDQLVNNQADPEVEDDDTEMKEDSIEDQGSQDSSSQEENVTSENTDTDGIQTLGISQHSREGEIHKTEEQNIYISLLEDKFSIRQQAEKKEGVEVYHSQVILNMIDHGTNNFAILFRAYLALTTKISKDLLSDKEQEQMSFCQDKKLIQIESGGNYFITNKGKEMMVEIIEMLKKIDLDEQQITDILDRSEEIMMIQEQYGKQTYARTRLHLLQILGLLYYRTFKVVPPLILSITNFFNKIGKFRFEDPEEFVSIFEAKFVSILEQYRQDIINNSSKVRDEYIDTEEKPVPRPFPEKEEEEDIEIVGAIEMEDVTLAGRGRLAKPHKLIETEDSQSLDDTLPEIDPVAPGPFPRSEKETKDNLSEEDDQEDQEKDKLILEEYEPQPLTQSEIEKYLVEYAKGYRRDQGEKIRYFTSDRDKKTRPLIYARRTDVDPEMINDFPLSYLNINGRITNALKRVNIRTVGKFRKIKCTTEISGIGKVSMQDIEKMQRILADPEKLPAKAWLHLFDLHGQNELLDAGIIVPLQELPTDVFFPYPDDLVFLQEQLYQQEEPKKMTLHFVNQLLGNIFHDSPAQDLTEAIHLLSKHQKQRYELLYDPGYDTKTKRKALRVDTVYRLQDEFDETGDPRYIEETVNMLMRQAEKIHVNSNIYHA